MLLWKRAGFVEIWVIHPKLCGNYVLYFNKISKVKLRYFTQRISKYSVRTTEKVDTHVKTQVGFLELVNVSSMGKRGVQLKTTIREIRRFMI